MTPMPQPTPEQAAMPQQPQAPGFVESGLQDEYDDGILEGLENHLNSLPDDQKNMLAEIFSNPQAADVAQLALGIVNGVEVSDYFTNIRRALGSLPQDSQAQTAQQPSQAPANGNPMAAQIPQQQTATSPSGNPLAGTPTR